MCGAPRSGLSSTGHVARADLVDLAADRDHRVAERVDLGQALALGRLDHQRARHREAHRRRVETVVRQPFCHVVDGDAGGLGDAAQIEDALVGHHAVLAGVQHRVVLVEAAGDVVGRCDRGQRRRTQAGRAHHPDVGPGDRQDRRRTVRRRRHRCAPRVARRPADGRAGTAPDARAPPPGPTPGPPPPCGMQNVLCRFRWLTSPPNRPGRARPTSALRLAPSTYTCPPTSCTAAQMSAMSCS